MNTILVFIAGLFLGSLLNVVIIRIPREKRLLGWPRCTRTGEVLAWWQLLPVLGWVLQRGRARNGQPLHWIYPAVEVLTAVVLTRLYLVYGQYDYWLAFVYLSFVCVVLIVTGVIDWLYRFIYTFVILGAALLALFLGPAAGMNGLDVLLGALVAGLGFALLFFLAQMMFPGKSAPFGLGDVYLGIFIGAAVGLSHLSTALFYGMLMAGLVALFIVVGRRVARQRRMPEYIAYGSYLCLGVIVYIMLWGI